MKQDRKGLGALYARASSRSRYLRFFTAGISIDREVQRLIAPADDHVALLAEHDGLAVGVASYEILSDDQAEFAVLVDDAWQGEGIGSLLIEQLAAWLAARASVNSSATCSTCARRSGRPRNCPRRRGPVFTHSSRYRRKAEWGGRRGYTFTGALRTTVIALTV